MPYSLKRISTRKWKVVNVRTGRVHSRTTLKKAKRQLRLLNAIEHGFIPT